MKGHIKLGAVGSTLRGYKLTSERSYRRVTANPYSAKISTGGGTYDDLEPFAYFLQTDWQSGIGHRKPEEGLLFSTAETRVPNQIILAQNVVQSDCLQVSNAISDCRNIGARACGGTISVSSTGAYRKVSIKMQAPSLPVYMSAFPTEIAISFYGYVPEGTVVNVDVGTSSGGATVAATTVTSATTYPGFAWYTTTLTAVAITSSTDYYITLYTNSGSFELACTASYSGAETKAYNGSSWNTISGTVYPIYTTNVLGLAQPGPDTGKIAPLSAVTRFNNTLYAAGGYCIFKRSAANDYWSVVGSARSSTVVGMCVFGTTLHIALASGNYDTMSTAEVFTSGGVTRQILFKWNGYLWGASAHNVHYTADGVAWSAAIPCGDASSYVTGIAGLGDAIYVATTEALYYIAPGDIAVGVTRWGSIRSTNGTSLIEYQGALYCIVDGGVAQISISGGSASILPMWLSRDDDLIANFVGAVVALTSANNWLFALVKQDTTPNKSSVLAWTGQGWHFVVECPLERCASLIYDFTTSYLWIGSRSGTFFRVRIQDFTLNPTNDTSSAYTPFGWLETGWISGGLKDVDKDWESVYINGDTLSSDQYVEVFYKSARDGDWTYLGKIDDYGEELRWSNYTTRPATKEIKLGFRLFSTSLTKTPDIDVIRVKFLPNVNDRWQWTLPIEVGPGQEMIDGTLNTYTVAQMRSHLEALVQSTPPFLLEDIDGTQYEVVCTGASVDVARLDHYNNEIVPWYIYTMTLEQVRGAAYA